MHSIWIPEWAVVKFKEKYSQGFEKSTLEQSVVEFHQHL